MLISPFQPSVQIAGADGAVYAVQVTILASHWPMEVT